MKRGIGLREEEYSRIKELVDPIAAAKPDITNKELAEKANRLLKLNPVRGEETIRLIRKSTDYANYNVLRSKKNTNKKAPDPVADSPVDNANQQEDIFNELYQSTIGQISVTQPVEERIAGIEASIAQTNEILSGIFDLMKKLFKSWEPGTDFEAS